MTSYRAELYPKLDVYTFSMNLLYVYELRLTKKLPATPGGVYLVMSLVSSYQCVLGPLWPHLCPRR